MLFSTILSITACAIAAQASPVLRWHHNNHFVKIASPFYLVTTTERHHVANSTQLAKVLSLGLVKPQGYENYFLIDEGPGNSEYPHFSLVDGNLLANFTGSTVTYETEEVQADSELAFSSSVQGRGDLSLVDGYLLAVNGSTTAWALCTETEQEGLSYIVAAHGSSTCKPTYIQAVNSDPYPYTASSEPLKH